MKPNRYIKAMEIGLAHEKEGISYFDLITELEFQLNFKFGDESELTFLVWFSQNFRRSDKDITRMDVQNYRWYIKQRNGIEISGHQTKTAKDVERDLKYKYWLNGEASKQYLDYQELVESRQTAQDAREASKEANKKAAKSICLAIASIVISGIVGVVSIIIDLAAPKPPYDVNVIEDKTKVERLEKENLQLKEELYKVEMMLKLHE
jgi:hypothetical protein